MIVANSTWGSWMAELGVPGIYRSQASLAPGVKVRMGTKALPHAGIGVKSYAWAPRRCAATPTWSTSGRSLPVRAMARLPRWPRRSSPRMPSCSRIISNFDAAYSAYNGYQAGMERFWTLKYLEQKGITELEATTFKEGYGGSWLVRADTLPLVFPVLGAQNLSRGARMRVKLGEIDEIIAGFAAAR
jgi:exoribonuclease-2